MISAVVLTHNNESTISRCLDSLNWCDEVVVVDDSSTDRTLEIVKTFKAKIQHRSLNNDFASQRNYSLKHVTGDWVLFVDSDEVVSTELAEEIRHAVQTTDNNGFYLQRVDTLFGAQLRFGETANVRLLRLGKRDKGVWQRSVHEIWNIDGPTAVLRHPLLHYPHQTMTEFIDEINRYSTLHASELFKSGQRGSGWQIIVYPFGKFIQNYIVRQGFRDGMPGAIQAIMMSFHSFLARGKLYLKSRERRV